MAGLDQGIRNQLEAAGFDPNDPRVLAMVQQMFRVQQKPKALLPESECLPGRESPDSAIAGVDDLHFIKKTPLHGPFPDHLETVIFGMGCFWCSEALFYSMEGVYSTQVGYAGGTTPNPTYREVCSGQTNHNEVTRVVYDPLRCPLAGLLKVFWETHDPTTPMRQGNDAGTQYRSSIFFTTEAQRALAEASSAAYAKATGRDISTEIEPAPRFWMGELDHQQYDAKPGNRQYCGLRPLGVALPEGWEAAA